MKRNKSICRENSDICLQRPVESYLFLEFQGYLKFRELSALTVKVDGLCGVHPDLVCRVIGCDGKVHGGG